MKGCKIALFAVLFVATSLFPTPVYSATWELLGTTTPTSGNTYPGSRYGATSWAANGTFWMFSGLGKESTSVEGYLTSLYKYNTTTSKWSLASGPTTTNAAAVFPTAIGGKGFPGGRYGAARWTDAAGNLWVFGGMGNGNDSTVNGLLNDMWKYTVATNSWNYFGGLQVAGGISTDAARPTPREGAATWRDANGNLWLHGGRGTTVGNSKAAPLTDMWYYSPTQSTWTSYFSESTPSARYNSASWTDKDGNGWLYGGRNADSNYLSDLWQFKVADLTWLLKSGTPNINQNPTYPTLVGGTGQPGGLHSASATSNNNVIYLFGGYGLDKAGAEGTNRDLWKFNATSATWTFVAGTPGIRTGSTTTPGARSQTAVASVNGYLYIFGGSGFDTNGTATAGTLGDNWRAQFCGFDNSCTAADVATTAASLTTGAKATTAGGFGSTRAASNTTAASSTSGGQGGSTTGQVEVTTAANVTIALGMVGDPAAVNTVAVLGSVADDLGIPKEFLSITIVYENGTVYTPPKKRAVSVPFKLVINVFFPNSSAIAAVTGGSASPNMTAALSQLQAAVTAAANSTEVRATLASSGLTITSVTATTTSQTVVTPVSSTTLPNWPYTTKSSLGAGFALTPSVLIPALVLATSLLALL
jgi:N-acetylneuraminic acid mutarotase